MHINFFHLLKLETETEPETFLSVPVAFSREKLRKKLRTVETLWRPKSEALIITENSLSHSSSVRLCRALRSERRRRGESYCLSSSSSYFVHFQLLTHCFRLGNGNFSCQMFWFNIRLPLWHRRMATSTAHTGLSTHP